MSPSLRNQIEEFKAKCLKIGIDLKDVAFIAEETDIQHLLEHTYGIGIKAEYFDHITISGVRVVKKI